MVSEQRKGEKAGGNIKLVASVQIPDFFKQVGDL